MINHIETQNEPMNEQPVLPFDPPLEERPPAEPSEIERLQAENADLQLRLRQREARDLVTDALKSAGARSPELIFEAAKAAIQIRDDGSIENVEAVVAEMEKRYPEQFGNRFVPSIDAGSGRTTSPGAITKEALAKMKPDEISKLDWATVREVLAN
jgi:hypothetical protein